MGRKWPKTILTFTGVFIFAILFRVFFIEIYTIPSGSMEDTLLPGDKVLVNKLVYGPKLPASPYDIPWVNLIWLLRADASANPDSVYWEYQRLQGFSNIALGDVMVFSHPIWGGRNNFFIKRCMGLPGDKLVINGSKVKINAQFLPEPKQVKKITAFGPTIPHNFIGCTIASGHKQLVATIGRVTKSVLIWFGQKTKKINFWNRAVPIH